MAHVMFSPTNPQHLISVSGSQVWHWNINGHQTNPPHTGSCIAFSQDGTQLVSCHGQDIVVQNSGSGEIIAKFHVVDSTINYCCFSPDGRLIAGGGGQIVHVWNSIGPHLHLIKTFVGHTHDITSLAFPSPSSLISSSQDRSVKFWEIETLQADPLVDNPESTSLSSAQIVSITLQTEDNIAISIDLERVVRTWDISTGLCKASIQTITKNSEHEDIQLINGRLILVWYLNHKFYLWDVEKGELLQAVDATLDADSDVEEDSGVEEDPDVEEDSDPDVEEDSDVEDIKISGDGSNVFCLHWGFIQAWSIQTGNVCKVELEICGPRRSLTVDGSRVWVHSPLSEPLGWDFGTPGSHPVQLSNSSLLLSNNTKLWDIHKSRIHDVVTRRVVFQLGGRFANPVKSQWDGCYLVACYQSGEVLILDFNRVHI